MKTKIQIKSMTGSILFEHEKEHNSIKDTVEEAARKGINLSGANLSGANLSGAELREADLTGADLREAELRGVNLIRAELTGANLSGANLSGANLSGAELREAELRGAENIPESYINICSRDLLYVFQTLKHELPALRHKLMKGEIDGTQYEGDCACLIGSLANIENKNYKEIGCSIPFYDLGLHNPGEQWFYQIRQGDTPENNFFAKHAVELIDMVLKEGK